MWYSNDVQQNNAIREPDHVDDVQCFISEKIQRGICTNENTLTEDGGWVVGMATFKVTLVWGLWLRLKLSWI